MVVIRLARRGAKKQPFYHITAADQRAPRDGKYIEKLGYYNPIARGNAQRLHVELDRVDYWLGVGAQTTETARRLLKEARIQAENTVEESEAVEESVDASEADVATEAAETSTADAEEVATDLGEEGADSTDASTEESDPSSEEQSVAEVSSEQLGDTESTGSDDAVNETEDTAPEDGSQCAESSEDSAGESEPDEDQQK